MAAADPDEAGVGVHEQMPQGYRFVPKGNVYITKNCRKQTHEAKKRLYVVLDKRNKPIGLRCPVYIHDAVMEQNLATAAQRATAVQKRDAAIEEGFEEVMLKLFPKIPKATIPQILKHSLKKHSGRVGRSGSKTLEDRVKLAVRAHIRHVHTNYDQLLKQGVPRLDARGKVWDKLNETAREWGGRPSKPRGPLPAKSKSKGNNKDKDKKSKQAAPSARKAKRRKNGAAKRAVVRTDSRPRALTRRMSREATKLSQDILRGAHNASKIVKVAHAGPRVRTRQMTSGMEPVEMGRKYGARDIELDADVNGFVEDVDVEDAVFTRAEDTSDYDSDGSEWSNGSNWRYLSDEDR